MEILRIVNMVPAVVVYNEDGEEKSTIVYLDYASQNLIMTEEIGSFSEFKKAVFTHIKNNQKPVLVPEIPRQGFQTNFESFNNFS
jgi:hypothetical protein